MIGSPPPQLETRQSLSPEDLARVAHGDSQALLAYLNMPPVGALDDCDRVPAAGQDSAYELETPVRMALRARRDKLGEFSDCSQVLDVPGFGLEQLDATLARLHDLTRYGHRAQAVWGGPEGEREFFALLESAERSIHIQTYLIGGKTGLRLAELLARKCRQGVATRVMFCGSGFVISGSPSGTGFVSRWSELRANLNDLYARKRILKAFREGGVAFVNAAPIGRHWHRRDFAAQGIRSAQDYHRWARERGLPDTWLEEQDRIDRECSWKWANVDHRKMVIVDGKRAFVGSQNIADSYFYANQLDPDPRVNFRNWQWHDSSTILEGGVVRKMTRLFAQRWALSGGDFFDPADARYSPPLERVGDAVVNLVATIPGLLRVPLSQNWGRFARSLFGADLRPIAVGDNPIRSRLMALPELAERDLYVEHCYPSDAGLLEHWSRLASRLKDFHLIVPLWYDTKVLGGECDRFFPELIAQGAQLHGFNRAILHSKILVMDGYYVATGSYNLNLRSARADLENELFIQDRDYGGQVRRRIEGDFDECIPVVPGSLARLRSHRSIPIFDAIVRYFMV